MTEQNEETTADVQTSDEKASPVRPSQRYVESEDHVPNPLDMTAQYLTTGFPGEVEAAASVAVAIDKVHTAEQILAALDPEDDETPAERVIVPEGDDAPDEVLDSLRAKAEKVVEKGYEINGLTPEQEKAAEQAEDDSDDERDWNYVPPERDSVVAHDRVTTTEAPAGSDKDPDDEDEDEDDRGITGDLPGADPAFNTTGDSGTIHPSDPAFPAPAGTPAGNAENSDEIKPAPVPENASTGTTENLGTVDTTDENKQGEDNATPGNAAASIDPSAAADAYGQTQTTSAPTTGIPEPGSVEDPSAGGESSFEDVSAKGGSAGEDEAKAPAKSASKADWTAYAKNVKGASDADLDGLGRDEIAAKYGTQA